MTADNPGPYTLEGTRSYRVGRGEAVLVDPGPDDPAAPKRWRALAGTSRVRLILLTHAHPDHAEGAARAAGLLDAGVAASRPALRALDLEGRALADDERVTVGDDELRVVATPGHSGDHLCFFRPGDRLVFTGDLVLGRGSSLVAHPHGSVGAYLRSLERLLELEPGRLLPGHGPDVPDGAARIRSYAEHRRERDEQVRAAVGAGARSVPEIREAVYGEELPSALYRAAEATISAHLAHLEELGRELPEITGRVELSQG